MLISHMVTTTDPALLAMLASDSSDSPSSDTFDSSSSSSSSTVEAQAAETKAAPAKAPSATSASSTSSTATTSEPSTKTTDSTVIPLTTIFTPPASCSTRFTYEPPAYNTFQNGVLLQNAVAVDSACFLPGFTNLGRFQGSQTFSPGYCPMGYTSANININGPQTTAICCLPNFSYSSSSMWAGCISSLPSSSTTIVSVRHTGLNEGTQVTGPMSMIAQPITVQLQATDSSLYASVIGTASPLPSSKAPSFTSAAPSSTPSTGLSTGAKAGIGAGVGVAGVAFLSLIALWFFHRQRAQRKIRLQSEQRKDSSTRAVELGGSDVAQESPVESEHKPKVVPIHELKDTHIHELAG
ncbi:hypothetical protein MW887_011829 [Aspergillus wentii]|nr:hypothetical protein MW887_011829 [Aspergillus wentii]